jgi:hypothetical protein
MCPYGISVTQEEQPDIREREEPIHGSMHGSKLTDASGIRYKKPVGIEGDLTAQAVAHIPLCHG